MIAILRPWKLIPLRRGVFYDFKMEAYDFGNFSHAPITHSEVQENIVPEPRAGSNSKARVHSNHKNLRLRPLQVLVVKVER